MKTILITASLLLTVCAALAQPIPIFPRQGTVWKYNQTDDVFAATGGTGWTAFNYNDSGGSWQEGPALLSNDSGNTGIAPLIGTAILGPRTPPGPAPAQHVRYFRKKFTYSGAVGPYITLRMNERIDDAAVFWLNGIEIGRLRVPATTTLDNLARGSALPCGGDADCENTYEIVLPTGAPLVVGDNILAVTCHQSPANSDSSDITFGLSLDIIPPRAPTILSNSEPADRVVLQNRTVTLRVYADAQPPPTYQWFYSTTAGGPFTAIQDATNSTHVIPSMQLANEGYYYATVSNPLGFVDSRTAFIDYTEDTSKPLLLNVMGSRTFDTIVAQFNEALDPTTSVDDFNWGVLDGNGDPVSLEPAGKALSADGTIVTMRLATGTFLRENELYTVDASGITDATQLPENTMDPTNLVFRSFVNGCNGFLFEAFDTASAPGNAVTLLTSHPNYPNNPRDSVNIASLDSRHAYTDNTHEQFGARVRGLFVPLVNGPHTFYIASDDAGQLFVNPNGPDATGKQLVAEETGCCNNFQPAGNPRTSAPLTLTAGRAYYVEALFKEGTGGDWLKVAARPSGDSVPPGGNTDNGSVIPVVIQGGAGPAGILSHVTIASQPASQSKIAGEVAAFSVGLSVDVPGCFQWKRNDVDIPGAVSPNYRLITSLADDGAKFRCAVSLMGGTTLLSEEATLSVSLDTTPPMVTNVTQDIAGNITVTFNEPMDLNTMTNRANYAIDGVTPASATASGNRTVVLAPGAPMAPCPSSHTVTVGNVRDANTVLISPNPTSVAVTLNNLLALPINASQVWRYNDAGEELGDAWYPTGFDDSAWSNGAPTLAFPAAEVIQAGFPVRTVLAGVRLTTYFRTHFNMPSDPSSVTNLQLNTILDDGGVFYLNGQELTRIRMPAGPVTTGTLANASSPSDPPQIIETLSVPAGALVFGDNVLAARVHQSSLTSSDTVFAAALVPQVSACTAERPRLKIEQNGNQVTISLRSGPNGTIYSSPSLENPTWTALGAAPQTRTIGTGNQFYEIRP